MARKKTKVEKVEATEENTLPQLHIKEVEEHVRTIMTYNNITKSNQKSELLALVNEQIGDRTEEKIIIQCFKEILKS